MARLDKVTPEEQAQIDKDWPEQPVATQSDELLAKMVAAGFSPTVVEEGSTPSEVMLRMPSGTAVPFTPQALKALTFADLSTMQVLTADETIGDEQFGPILEDKGKLCGVPFVIVHWEFHKGTFGGFVTMFILTQNNERFIVNDGSTGLAEQLLSVSRSRNVDSLLVCPGGFRVSEYEYPHPDKPGVMIPAKTYYIEAQQRVK